MSLRELTLQLIQSLDNEAQALTKLTAAMKERRMAFVDMRVSGLETGIDELAAPTEAALQASAARDRILADIAKLLGKGRIHRLGDVLDEIPADLRGRLDAIGKLAAQTAMASRIESRVGHRLLGQARRYRETMFGLTDEPGAKVYDQRARTARSVASSGSLLKGIV